MEGLGLPIARKKILHATSYALLWAVVQPFRGAIVNRIDAVPSFGSRAVVQPFRVVPPFTTAPIPNNLGGDDHTMSHCHPRTPQQSQLICPVLGGLRGTCGLIIIIIQVAPCHRMSIVIITVVGTKGVLPWPVVEVWIWSGMASSDFLRLRRLRFRYRIGLGDSLDGEEAIELPALIRL